MQTKNIQLASFNVKCVTIHNLVNYLKTYHKYDEETLNKFVNDIKIRNELTNFVKFIHYGYGKIGIDVERILVKYGIDYIQIYQ